MIIILALVYLVQFILPDRQEQFFEAEVERTPVKLYFIVVSDGQESLQYITRELWLEADQQPEELMLKQLLAGPTPAEEEQGFQTAIDPATDLLSLDIDEGVARVDFSSEIEPPGGSAWVLAIKDQVTRSLNQFSTVDEVMIMVEGETEGRLQP